MSDQATRVAMIGTGNVGGNLGVRLASVGVAVAFGVRDGDGAALLKRAPTAKVLPQKEAAASADVIFVAVPGSVAVDAVRGLGDLDGKVIVDCTNPIRWDAGPVWAPPEAGSNAAAIQHALPKARVVKSFNTFGAEIHGNPQLAGGPADVQIAGEDSAKATVAALAEKAGFRAVDAGPLRNAAVLENLAVLWIHIAMVGKGSRERAFVLQSR